MNSRLKGALTLTIPMVLFGLAGCGGSGSVDGRERVSGTVTLDGQPLERGAIEFVPADPGVATRSGAIVESGEFEVSAERGLEPGSYKVMITSSGAGAEVEEGAPPGEAPPPAPELIPPQFNVETTLTATVEAGGENTFSYDLQTTN